MYAPAGPHHSAQRLFAVALPPRPAEPASPSPIPEIGAAHRGPASAQWRGEKPRQPVRACDRSRAQLPDCSSAPRCSEPAEPGTCIHEQRRQSPAVSELPVPAADAAQAVPETLAPAKSGRQSRELPRTRAGSGCRILPSEVPIDTLPLNTLRGRLNVSIQE